MSSSSSIVTTDRRLVLIEGEDEEMTECRRFFLDGEKFDDEEFGGRATSGMREEKVTMLERSLGFGRGRESTVGFSFFEFYKNVIKP